MNKLFIVFLAVCLVTVNSSVVKRDAEKASPNYLEEAQKTLQDFSKNVGDSISKAFNPDEIKKSFSDGIDTISKFFNDPNKQGEAKQ